MIKAHTFWLFAALLGCGASLAADLPETIDVCRKSEGLSGKDFVICQTMPLDELEQVNSVLTATGLQPICIRPYRDRDALKVAAVWKRLQDETRRIELDLPAEDFAQRCADYAARKLQLVDVAAYDRLGTLRLATVWAQSDGPQIMKTYISIPEPDHNAAFESMRANAMTFKPFSLQLLVDNQQVKRYTALWNAKEGDLEWQCWWGNLSFFESKQASFVSSVPLQSVSLAMQNGQPMAAGVWLLQSGRSDCLILGTPPEVVERSAAIAERGDWPVSISVTARPDGTALSALLWHRNTPPELEAALADRQQARKLREQGKLQEAIKLGESALEVIRKEVGARTLRVAHLQWDLAVWHREQKEFERALELLQQARETYRLIGGEGSADYTDTLIQAGKIQLESGQRELAAGEHRTVLPLLERAYASDRSKYVEILLDVGVAHQLKGDKGVAIEFLTKALPLLEPDDSRWQAANRTLAFAYFDTQQYAAAEPLWRRLLVDVPPDAADRPALVRGFAQVLYSQGRHAEAIENYQTALSLLPNSPVDRENILSWLVAVCRDSSNAQAGIPACEELQQLRAQRGESQSRTLARGLRDLAEFQRLAGRLVEARANVREALRIVTPTEAGSGNEALLVLITMFRVELDDKQFKAAESVLAQARSIAAPDVPGSQQTTVMLLRLEGMLRNATKDFDRSLTALQQAADLQVQVSGPESRLYADTLSEMAQTQRNLKQRVLAEQTQAKAVAIYRKHFGDGNKQVIEALRLLASFQEQCDASDRAEGNRRLVLEWQLKAHGAQSAEAATATHELGETLITLQKFGEGVQLIRQAYDLRETIVPEGHPDRLASLARLGSVYAITADLPQAATYFERHLRVVDPLKEQQPEEYLRSVTALTNCLKRLERWEEAGRQLQAAREFAERVFGAGSIATARLMLSQSDLHRQRSENAQAEELLLKAHEICKVKGAADSGDRKDCLVALAMFYESLGDTAKGAAYRKQVSATPESFVGHRDVSARQELSDQIARLVAAGQNADALPLLREALTQSRALGEKSVTHALAQFNLAQCLVSIAEYGEADTVLQQAEKLVAEVFGPETELRGYLYLERGRLHAALGEDREAHTALNQAIAFFSRPNRSALTRSSAQGRKGFLHLAQNQLDLGRPLLQAAFETRVRLFHLVLPGLSSGESQAYLSRPELWVTRDGLLQTLVGDDRVNEAFSVVNRTRALLLHDFESRRRRVFASDQAREVFRQLGAKRRELAQTALTSVRPDHAAAHQTRLALLNDEKESLEKALARITGVQPAEPKQLEAVKLARRLPPDMAVLELVSTIHTPSVEPGRSLVVTGEERYEAFVVRGDNDAPVRRISLGPRVAIDELLQRWLVGLNPSGGVTPKERDNLSAQVREQIWSPIESLLAGRKTIVVVPDGAFTRLPWAALPGSRVNTALLEEGYGFVVLSSSQRLLELLEDTPAPLNEGPLLLVGGVDYGKQSGGVGSLGWSVLPNSLDEAKAISAIWPDPQAVQLLTGSQAGKPEVLSRLLECRVAHLATHGFFAEQENGFRMPQYASAELSFRAGPDAIPAAGTVSMRNPLLASGVVLAAANVDDENIRGGLLTAEEVAAADLRNLRLVVLSACDTALGRTDRENVLGLQTAFQMAGAKSVVGTLWSVDDRATEVLMIEFYRNLLQGKLPMIEALRRAQLAMLDRYDLREHRLRGLTLVRQQADIPTRLPPYFWAAFSLSGDWR